MYDKLEFIKMESRILKVLDFDVIYASPYKFLNRLHQASMLPNKEAFYVGQYFLELCLLDSEMSSVKSSIKAAASYFIALKITKTAEKYKNLYIDLEEICKINKTTLRNISSKICLLYETSRSSNFKHFIDM